MLQYQDPDRAKVRLGNACVRASLSVIDTCGLYNIPAALEHPQTSWLWSLPEMQERMVKNPGSDITCHMCAFGTDYKKPTRVFMFHSTFQPQSPKCLKCKQRKKKLPNGQQIFLCSFTGKPHQRLSGAICSGKFKTCSASEYPAPFGDWGRRLLMGQAES